MTENELLFVFMEANARKGRRPEKLSVPTADIFLTIMVYGCMLFVVCCFQRVGCLNLLLTDGIPPDFRGGVHLFI